MRTLRLATILSLTLSSAALVAQNVSYDYDKTADFSRFKTYTWVRGTVLADELNHRRVTAAIESELAARGFTRVETAVGADVIVAYHASFDHAIEINGFSSGWGGYRFGGMRNGTARVDEILSGTLAVDMVNARTNVIVWRGMASKEVNVNAKPETRERNINKAVEKIFGRFPVRPVTAN